MNSARDPLVNHHSHRMTKTRFQKKKNETQMWDADIVSKWILRPKNKNGKLETTHSKKLNALDWNSRARTKHKIETWTESTETIRS